MISLEQTQLIRNTWGKVIAYGNVIGEQFYTKFFAEHPELQPLFKANKREQSFKLLSAITLMVTKLDKMDRLREEMRGLAKRHIKYQVKPEYFVPFGILLLETIAEVLGSDTWTVEVDIAWQALWQECAQAMTDALQDAIMV